MMTGRGEVFDSVLCVLCLYWFGLQYWSLLLMNISLSRRQMRTTRVIVMVVME